MSFVLFQAGQRRPPRTAARRILWGILTLVPLGVIAACFTAGAFLTWTGEGMLPESDRFWLTLYAAFFDLVFVLTLVVGVIRVVRQFAQERANTLPS